MSPKDFFDFDFRELAERIASAGLSHQRNNGSRREWNGEDDSNFQFWPTGMAMGSLIGKQFLQVICS